MNYQFFGGLLDGQIICVSDHLNEYIHVPRAVQSDRYGRVKTIECKAERYIKYQLINEKTGEGFFVFLEENVTVGWLIAKYSERN